MINPCDQCGHLAPLAPFTKADECTLDLCPRCMEMTFLPLLEWPPTEPEHWYNYGKVSSYDVN